MSVKELVLKQGFNDKKITVETSGEGIEIVYGNNEQWIVLNRGQAHMLFLYLQEYLKS